MRLRNDKVFLSGDIAAGGLIAYRNFLKVFYDHHMEKCDLRFAMRIHPWVVLQEFFKAIS
jgi:hypothetical protein